MIESTDLRRGNLVNHEGEQITLDEDRLEVLFWARNYEDFKPIKITREILRDNLGFTVTDMGDYWMAEKEDFVLIQPKFQIMKGVELDFIFRFKTTVGKSFSIKHVHHLQNVYYFTQQKELEWKS